MSAYQCMKCNHKTSGVISSKEEDVRRCPICNSTLSRCEHCFNHVSFTNNGTDIEICDHCKKPQTSQKQQVLK